MRAFSALLGRDLHLAVRSGGGFGLSLVFFISVVSVTPFALGPDLALLGRIAPAILWIGALLASLIGLDRLFQTDLDDGSLDLLSASSLPLPLSVLAKCLAHWLVTGLPLALAAPVLGLLLNIAPNAILPVMLTLFVGTPALTLLGAIGAALTVTLRRGGLLVPVLILPLAVPVLIFAVAATAAVESGGFGTAFSLLSGISLGCLALAPFAAAAALKAGQQ
jgi:heme exporter protein B